ncbi:MAG: hypothetical protein IJK89_00525 [Clostridia bacterium]|nr:hypothetical protein [Clostridia bacterium]
MQMLRFIGLPAAVRRFISILAALIILTGSLGATFTTPEEAARYMLPGDGTFSAQAGGGWTVGFAKAILTPDDVGEKTYYIAGYNSNNPAEGVLDDMYARAVYLDDNTGRGGVVLCAIDCVGLSRHDINEIRAAVIESGRIPDLKSVNICSTHTHSAIDTQGLWGKSYFSDGKDAAFQARLKEKTAAAILAAYDARRDGKLYYGTADISGKLADTRTPIDFDPLLTRVRFAPSDGSAPVYLVHMGCHPELLGRGTKNVSADFPAYMGKEIEARTGGEFLFINGAVGGQISSDRIEDVLKDPELDCEAYMKQYGKEIGGIALDISDETEIAPLVNIRSQPVSLRCDNTIFQLGKIIRILTNDIQKQPFRTKMDVLTEISYMELGEKQLGLFLIPGELYYELYSGNFLPAEESANGFAADYKVLSEMTDCERSFVVGLCNDALGYIIPDNDFMNNEWLGFFDITKDQFGRTHYEETNSVGPDEARTLLEAMDALTASVRP